MSQTQMPVEHPRTEVLVRRLDLDAADELGTFVQQVVDEVNNSGRRLFSVYARFLESSIAVAAIVTPTAEN